MGYLPYQLVQDFFHEQYDGCFFQKKSIGKKELEFLTPYVIYHNFTEDSSTMCKQLSCGFSPNRIDGDVRSMPSLLDLHASTAKKYLHCCPGMWSPFVAIISSVLMFESSNIYNSEYIEQKTCFSIFKWGSPCLNHHRATHPHEAQHFLAKVPKDLSGKVWKVETLAWF